MKSAIWGGAVLASVVAATSPASAAFILWQGDLFVTNVNGTSAQCNAVNMAAGDFARFVYRPRAVPGSTNGNVELLSWNFPRSSGQLSVAAGTSLDAATTAPTVRTIFGSAGYSQLTNVPIDATVNPPTPTNATASVAVTITINNFNSSAPATPSGCNLTFSGTLSKRP